MRSIYDYDYDDDVPPGAVGRFIERVGPIKLLVLTAFFLGFALPFLNGVAARLIESAEEVDFELRVDAERRRELIREREQLLRMAPKEGRAGGGEEDCGCGGHGGPSHGDGEPVKPKNRPGAKASPK